ncbi:MAG TPA: MATE family efflux transporter [Candidatus Hydrogenedentes bacterium]|nr:MATE family efflux transporter [Candidatus Hydrogenedentota bacterium]HOS03992.1 MATE family efflux transporter [Candidatus Hydrogenedentota bacterium]
MITESESSDTTHKRGESRWAGLREVLNMAIPVIVGSFSYTLMGFVDQAMVGRLGSSALAAVGSGGIWAFTVSTFFIGVTSCVATFVSQSRGRGDFESCGRYAWQGIHFSLLTGAIGFFCWPISGPLFRSMHHAPDVTAMEIQYFQLRMLGFAFVTWQTALASFFQAVRRPHIPTLTAIASNLVNFALNYALIFGHWGFPAMGIRGSAIATVIALGCQVAMMQALFLGPRHHAEFRTRSSCGLDFQKMRELLRIGWPAGMMFLIDIVNWSVFTSYIVGHFGTTQLAAHNAAMNFMALSFMPAVGLNHAIAPIVGQWIGRGDIARAKARTYTALRLAIGYMTCMGILMGTFGAELIRSVFSVDPEVVRIGKILLVLAALFQAFDAVNITVSGALRGAGDTRWMAVMSFLGTYLFFLPLALFFAFVMHWQAVGAWIGATAYIIALSGVLFLRFHREKWRHISIFTPET